ncbi:hypothetical protein [Sphingomonas montanisoli]|uniref:Uncharacterized protein n=1 Tax=Sphingomonas montanisoli TaxID=2606412 RepID=A0A5D9BXQ3_9SPHN|nr:hypothetical protein [Sphingomonas montanisoli]TZG24156.1 hypothetical protein FYJ91_20200 [Sphingomonas montanisoli]
MILGLSVQAFVALHVAISLIGIAAGLIALPAMIAGRYMKITTAIFLAFTALTSLTGFLFPFAGFTPALGFGVISTIDLIIAAVALYVVKLQGMARITYTVTAVIALYLNLFVLVVQSFLKVPALNALAPTGTEPPFAVAQGVVLIANVALGYLIATRFRPAALA